MGAIIKSTQSPFAATAQGLKTVKLRGELGRRFGRQHRFAVRTPAEAIRALSANFKGFRQFMAESEQRGVAYKVWTGSYQIQAAEEVTVPAGRGDIEFVPVIGGAKRGGFGGILLGGALIAASFFMPATPLFTIGTFAPSVASIAFNTGLSLALGGITSMLTPTPKSTAPSERPENKPSYYFEGAVNTVAEGQPVPVGYGRLIVGGAILSAGISTDDIIE